MYLIADGLTRLMAPILSFTADELWRYLPGAREDSVHMAVFPAEAELDALADRELARALGAADRLREQVLAEIEPLRKNKRIGSSLQAKVILTVAAGRAGVPRGARARAADAVHRVGRRAAAGGAGDERSASSSSAPAASNANAAGATWRSVSTDPALGGLVRPLPGGAGRRPCLRKPSAGQVRSRRAALEVWLPIAIVVLDQLTKAMVRSMVPLSSSVEVVPGFMNITHVRNTGAAFGFLNAADFPLKTVVIAVIALGGHRLGGRVRSRACRGISGWRGSAWPSSWAAPPATCSTA